MSCFHPLAAWQLDDGTISFVERRDCRRSLVLPCGQCIGCRLERSRQWAVRCVHEASLYDFSSFVTLTYSELNLSSFSLVYRDFQLFMKRLRRAKAPQMVRFYMAGEYGDQHGRPHFHACLFGCFFPDRVLYRELPSGSNLFTSAELEGYWPHGFSSVGDVTFESAAYIARYCMKKITGAPAKEHYSLVHPDTGEVIDRVPEFNRMSLKPGIGAGWLEKFHAEVYPRDVVRMNGVDMLPPKYYDKKWGSWDALSMEAVAFSRAARGEQFRADTTPERLAVREEVTRARLTMKLRSIPL